jgi:hypothetical protein
MDKQNGARRVARFESAGDVREVYVGEEGQGGFFVREEVAGPSSLLVYDEERHVVRVGVREAAAQKLAKAKCWQGDVRAHVEEYLSREDNALIDLMDACDAAGVEYTYATLGKDEVLQYRPASS